MHTQVYADWAATSWPKAPLVTETVADALAAIGNPGRAGHSMANAAARTVFGAREAVAELFGCADPLRVAFGPNVTWALNVVLRGLLKPGDHVLTSSVEHNSVMRPLRALERNGVRVSCVRCESTGTIDLGSAGDMIAGDTRLVVVTHASNVTGAIQPVRELSDMAHKHGAMLLLDSAQTAGCVPCTLQETGADIIAFTGHKGLLGPMGTGGLVFADHVDPTAIEPLERGGTGSDSEHEEQPEFLPDRFESGTPNVHGLAGLTMGVLHILDQGAAAVRAHEIELTGRLLNGLNGVDGLTLHGPLTPAAQTAVLSLSFSSLSSTGAALQLEERHGILCRAGLHCSPACHRTIGTFPSGTVRVSFGALSTTNDVDRTVSAIRAVAQGA